MALPDLSNSLYVANLRYIQSIHEPPPYSNPDTQGWRFLPLLQRWRAKRLRRDELATLRSDPFYYYLLARTRYYDRVFSDAVAGGVGLIVGIGCGSDTRAYRFDDLWRRNGVRGLECDQGGAIRVKTRLVRRWGRFDHVEYMALDLNDDDWPEFFERVQPLTDRRTLVMLEGVSPYVDARQFQRFLARLASTLSPASEVAYDFKLEGVNDGFGREGRTKVPFRLPDRATDVDRFHDGLGLRMTAFELSSDLAGRLLPELAPDASPRFAQDALIRLRVG